MRFRYRTVRKLHIAMTPALCRLRVMTIINQFMHIYPDINIIAHLDDEVDM